MVTTEKWIIPIIKISLTLFLKLSLCGQNIETNSTIQINDIVINSDSLNSYKYMTATFQKFGVLFKKKCGFGRVYESKVGVYFSITKKNKNDYIKLYISFVKTNKLNPFTGVTKINNLDVSSLRSFEDCIRFPLFDNWVLNTNYKQYKVYHKKINNLYIYLHFNKEILEMITFTS